MDLNPLYDQKKVSTNSRIFEKNLKRVGKHSLIAQINAEMLQVENV